MKLVTRIFSVIILTTSLVSTSCAPQKLSPEDLKTIYKDGAKQSDLHRNPVIVIPGILGSKLYDTEMKQEIWGIFNNRYTEPNTERNAQSVALPMLLLNGERFGKDSIVSTGALDRVKFSVLGIPLAPRAYAAILETLGAAGYRDQSLSRSGAIDYGTDHFTCFQFHYDWRRSNAENAAKLDAFIKAKRVEVRTKMKQKFGVDKKDIKFDIVAHSMGGLVSRYYMRYGNQQLPKDGSLPKLTWAGAQNVEKVILVGTPNSGSVLAFEELLRGKEFAPKWLKYISATNLPSYSAAIIGTYPSLYELLPRTRHNSAVDNNGNPVNIYDLKLWKKYNWGLLSEKSGKELPWLLPNAKTPERRRELATSYIKRCLENAQQFHRALDRKGVNQPKHLKISLIAGDAIQTKERIKVHLSDGSIEDNNYTAGDGVVLRTSVLADQRAGGKYTPGLRTPIDYDQIIFLPYNHLNLTKSTLFSDQVLHRLLEE